MGADSREAYKRKIEAMTPDELREFRKRNNEREKKRRLLFPERVKQQKRQEYLRHKDKYISRADRWRKTENGQSYLWGKGREAMVRWRKANPEVYSEATRRNAIKGKIARALGVSCRDVPEALFNAKMAQIEVLRALREKKT